MSALDVDVVVLGGGVAGLAAAESAARAGAMVALVDPGPLGGDALHRTLVPWRALERASGEDGWAAAQAERERVRDRLTERYGLRLGDQGVEQLRGRGRFTDANTLAVDGADDVRFERAVVASGGAPVSLGEGARILDPGRVLDLKERPSAVLVVGGGAAGAELASALNHLGVDVSWLMDELGILPAFDRELAETLGDVLMSRGVKLVHGKRVEAVSDGGDAAHAKLDGGRTYAAPFAIVCAGTRPRLDGLGLDALGLTGLAVDAHCRTKVEHVFAAGECTPGCPSAAAAEAMGRIAGLGAAGASAPEYRPDRIPRIVRANPELAQIGLTPEQAGGQEVALHTLPGGETIADALEGVGESLNSKGFFRLVCASSDGEVIGASAAGPGAIEKIGAIGLAMGLGATESHLRRLAPSLPGPLEALRRAVY